jgi:hypothetical protein
VPGYVLDTSIWIRVGDNHPPDIFVSLWEQLDAAIASRDVRSPEEVLHELERGAGDDLAATLRARPGLFAALDEPLQRAVAEVVARCPGFADPNAERNRADPFVVALARVLGATVVSGERPRRAATAPHKIPDACAEFGVPHLDWFGFLRAMGWRL